jgi:hypothetical protein
LFYRKRNRTSVKDIGYSLYLYFLSLSYRNTAKALLKRFIKRSHVSVHRIAAALLIIDMIGAIFLVKISKGFVGGYELESLLMAICISLLLTGPGRISIEWDVLKREIFPRGRSIIRQQKEDVQRV